MITCWFDGACGPESPGGHAGYGAIVKRDGRILFSEAGYVGHGSAMTCNVAEYAGAIAVLKYLLAHNLTEALIYGDSDLVIKQLNRQWKAKKGLYLPYFREAITLRLQLPNVQMKWIPRERNDEADALSKQAINKKGGFRRPHLTLNPQEQSMDYHQRIDTIQIAREMQSEKPSSDDSPNPILGLLFMA
jgi:ribonuclease HI